MSTVFHLLFAQKDDIDFMLKLVDRKISNFRAQNGTKEHPARSCREIQLDHPNFESGLYYFSFVTLLVLFTCPCKVTHYMTTQKRLYKCMNQPAPRLSALLPATNIDYRWTSWLVKTTFKRNTLRLLFTPSAFPDHVIRACVHSFFIFFSDRWIHNRSKRGMQ